MSFYSKAGSSWRAAQHHWPGKHLCHPGQEVSTQPVSHPGLAAAPNICSTRVSPLLHSTTCLCQHNFPQLAPTHSGVHVGCPTMQITQALALANACR